MQRIRRTIILLTIATAVSWAQSSAPAASGAQAISAVSATQPPRDSGFSDRSPRYELVPGDTLDLKFEFTPEFDQASVPVQPDGFISLNGIGDVPVAGKTLPEVRVTLQQAYSKILNRADIHVTLHDFEKPYFVASGYVRSPGKYDLRGPTMLTQAVAMAGGFRDGAKHSEVWVFHRLRDGTVQSKRIDVKHMLNKGELAEDVRLQPGDTIYVPQSLLSKLESFVIPRATIGPTLTPSLKP